MTPEVNPRPWPPPESQEYRIVDLDALRASRCAPVFTKAKGQTNAAKSGLRYEKRVGRELVHLVRHQVISTRLNIIRGSPSPIPRARGIARPTF
jgi:hypothetical protein